MTPRQHRQPLVRLLLERPPSLCSIEAPVPLRELLHRPPRSRVAPPESPEPRLHWKKSIPEQKVRQVPERVRICIHSQPAQLR